MYMSSSYATFFYIPVGEFYGYDVTNRTKVDTWIKVTAVDTKHRFESAGEVTHIKFWAGDTLTIKVLILGIFKKESECNFTLLRKYRIPQEEITEGENAQVNTNVYGHFILMENFTKYKSKTLWELTFKIL